MSRLRLQPIRRCFGLITGLAIGLSTFGAVADESDFTLIRHDLRAEPVRLTSITAGVIEYRDHRGSLATVSMEGCIGLFSGAPMSYRKLNTGMVTLVDGQRLPGRAISGARPDSDALGWSHAWLGRLQVPLDRVRSVIFKADVTPPETREMDVVVLANGDRWEGFLLELGDPISIEVETDGEAEEVSVPLERVVAVSLVSPRRESEGQRVWFRDGTVIDVNGIHLGADRYFRLTAPALLRTERPAEVQLQDVTAVLVDPDRMTPLVSMKPVSVTGPETRYVVPAPRAVTTEAPLDLAPMELRGPIVVRYTLPPGTTRFAAIAELPVECFEWGNFEFVVRDNGRKVFQAHLDADQAQVLVHVPLTGSELTLEMTPGAHGAIQDRLLLRQAMIGK